jgi:hypothetical protein
MLCFKSGCKNWATIFWHKSQKATRHSEGLFLLKTLTKSLIKRSTKYKKTKWKPIDYAAKQWQQWRMEVWQTQLGVWLGLLSTSTRTSTYLSKDGYLDRKSNSWYPTCLEITFKCEEPAGYRQENSHCSPITIMYFSNTTVCKRGWMSEVFNSAELWYSSSSAWNYLLQLNFTTQTST